MSSSPPPPQTALPTPAPEPPPPDAPSTRGPDEPPWAVWTAPAAVAVGLVVGVLGSVVVGAIGAGAGSSLSSPTPAVSLISDVVFDLGFVVTALYFASLSGRLRPADFGYRRIPLMLGFSAFLAAGVAYYVVTAVYQTIVKLHGTDKLPSDLGVTTSTAALVGAAIFVCVIAPICEEFFFRGFIFGALRRWHITIRGHDIGTWVAAVLTGILFGLAHTGSAAAQYLIPLGFLGFVLCIVRWKTGSLYPCMALHSVNNSLALGYNELHWNGGEILSLMAGALLVIAAITGPLSSPSRSRAV